MNTKDKELLKDALRAIERWSKIDADDLVVTHKIRERLSSPEDNEPVAYIASEVGEDDQLYWDKQEAEKDGYSFTTPLYRHP